MTKTEKKALTVAAAVAGGTVVGAVVTPAVMVANACSVVTYPLIGAVTGAAVAIDNGRSVPEAVVAAVGGGVLASVFIPFGPLYAVVAPVVHPAWSGLMAGSAAASK